jgi:hypothetical protein
MLCWFNQLKCRSVKLCTVKKTTDEGIQVLLQRPGLCEDLYAQRCREICIASPKTTPAVIMTKVFQSTPHA